MQTKSALLGLVVAASIGTVLGLSGCTKSAVPPDRLSLPGLVPPLNDAQVGEELVLRRGSSEWRYSVTDAGDAFVVVEVLQYENGEPTAKPERYRWHRNGFGMPEDAVIRKIERGRLDSDGEAWDCWVLHVYTRERGRFYYWVSDEAAVHGVVKMAKVEEAGVDDANAIYWAGTRPK